MKKNVLGSILAMLAFAFSSHAQTTIYSEDFESCSVPSLPSGWTNVHTGAGMGWQTSSTSVSISSIVIPAHTKFALVNDGGLPANYPAKSATTTFSLAGTSHVYLSYDAWFPGYHLSATGRREQAWVELSTDGGTTYSTIDTFVSDTAWTTRVVAITTASSTCKLRFVYTDNRVSTTDTSGMVGCGIDNIRVFSAIPTDIALASISPVAGDPANDFATVGNNITFGGTAYNNGYNTITSFTASYVVGGGSVVSATVSATIAPFTSYSFTCTTPYTVTSVGTSSALVYLTLSGDTAHRNDTLATSITGASFTPTKRLLFEDAFGTWCGFNVRSIVYMDSMWAADSNSVSLVEVHDGSGYDPMAAENTLTRDYDSYMGALIPGYPSVRVDRMPGTIDPSNLFTAYTTLHNNFGFANIAISPTYSSGSLSVNCTVNPALNLSGDYRLELILTEDNVRGTASGYAQHNYYNTGAYGAMGGTRYGYDFVTLPSVIPASLMHYDFVGRYTVPDMASSPNGVAGSLPSSMSAGGTYSYSFSSISIPGTWSVPNLHAVVLLIDNNSSSLTYGRVLNTMSAVVTAPPTVSGPSIVCQGSTATFTTSGASGTWSSSNASVATVSTTGIVTGVSVGTAIISYTNSAGTGTATITVNPLPNAGTISGPTSLCPSATTTYTESVTGGTWSSSNPSVATIIGSGFTASISAGTAVISYSVTNSCGTAVATLNLTVSSTASAGTIVGTSSVCVTTSTTYTDATTGGTWSSSNPSVATVNPASGLVTGVSVGSAIITYYVTLSCGSALTTQSVTVNSGPYAGTLSGASTVCQGATTTITPSVTGGTWASSNTALATVSSTGIVTGVTAGSITISYTVNNGCGAATAMQSVTVNPLPAPGAITGADTVCVGDTTTFGDTTVTGVWSSSNTTVATINTSGRVKGLSAGAVVISFTATNGCGSVSSTHPLFVSNAGICHTGVAEVIVNDAVLLVYPNPSSGIFTIEIPSLSIRATITVMDIYGKTIMVKNTENKTGLKEQVDLSKFAKGTYLIKVDTGNASYREKVIVW